MQAAGWLNGLWTLVVFCGLLAASCTTQLDRPKALLSDPQLPTLHTQPWVHNKILDSGSRPLALPGMTSAAGSSFPRKLESRISGWGGGGIGSHPQVTYAHAPLHFEPKQGQTDEQVHFLSRGRGYTLFLTSTEAVLALRKPREGSQQNLPALRAAPFAKGAFGSPPLSKAGQGGFRQQDRNAVDSAPLEQTALRMQFVGANPNPQIAGHEALPGQVNYFIGNDPDKWRTNIPTFAKVKYQEVYPGVDLVYYGNQQELEFDFVVAPGADPTAIRLAFDGLVGAVREPPLQITENGDLILPTDGGEVRLHKPLIYQEIDGVKQPIPGGYVLLPLPLGEGRGEGQPHVGFEVAAYDRSKPLIIDPVLNYSTYLGGNEGDYAYALAPDGSGGVWVAGYTLSTNFPMAGGGSGDPGDGVGAMVATPLSAISRPAVC